MADHPFENWRPRGPRKYSWTYGQLADITGLSERTLMNYACAGKFDPHSFESVVVFILRRGVTEESLPDYVLNG